jgi:hypothetical protein
LYDPEISEGKILIGVANPPDASIAKLERTLSAGGSGDLRRISWQTNTAVGPATTLHENRDD